MNTHLNTTNILFPILHSPPPPQQIFGCKEASQEIYIYIQQLLYIQPPLSKNNKNKSKQNKAKTNK
jgi:hypothetical protein